MPRFSGWRRLSGDASDRPDLIDLGKRLLGYLAEQRRLSGVKTLSIRRQAPDGSTVIARFVGELPSIEVIAAAPSGGPRIAYSLRAFCQINDSDGNYRIAVADIALFDAQSGAYLKKHPAIYADQSVGSLIPRSNFCIAVDGQSPPVTPQRAGTTPTRLAFVRNGGISLYDPRMSLVGSVANTLWSTVYGESVGVGTETVEFLLSAPSAGKLIAIGWARNVPFNQRMEDVAFVIDTASMTAIAGAKVSDIVGDPAVDLTAFGPTPVMAPDGVFYIAHGISGGQTLLLKVDASLAVLASTTIAHQFGSGFSALTLSPDGTTLFARSSSGVCCIDTATLVLTSFVSIALPDASLPSTVRRSIHATATNLLLWSLSGSTNVVQVRQQSDLALLYEIDATDLASQIGSNWPRLVPTPDDAIALCFTPAGKVALLDMKRGTTEFIAIADFKYQGAANLTGFNGGNGLGTPAAFYAAR